MQESSEEALQQLRLWQFLRSMLPIAVGFLVLYSACAYVLRSVALAGGAGAVLVYVVALVGAQRRARRGQTEAASRLSGYALLVMIALGALFLHFLLPALLMIPLAGV